MCVVRVVLMRSVFDVFVLCRCVVSRAGVLCVCCVFVCVVIVVVCVVVVCCCVVVVVYTCVYC